MKLIRVATSSYAHPTRSMSVSYRLLSTKHSAIATPIASATKSVETMSAAFALPPVALHPTSSPPPPPPSPPVAIHPSVLPSTMPIASSISGASVASVVHAATPITVATVHQSKVQFAIESLLSSSSSQASQASSSVASSSSGAVVADETLLSIINGGFDPKVPIEEAFTPPAEWYTQPDFLQVEKEAIFKQNWIVVGRADQLKTPGDFFTCKLLGEPLLITMDETRSIRAFFNVCKHHAACVEKAEHGNATEFVCPYHGWTYALNGRLKKATRLKGIKNFSGAKITLTPLKAEISGPFVFVHFGEPKKSAVEEFSSLHTELNDTKYQDLQFVKRVVHHVPSNWKVYCDNYLDGGYHVPIAHVSLNNSLDMTSYRAQLFDRHSTQYVSSRPANGPVGVAARGGAELPSRVAGEALYAFMYPNFMINRYGPWMDTNLVWPLTHDTCAVIFDYYLDTSIVPKNQLESYVTQSLRASAGVQEEDRELCESVQSGLRSTAYRAGRYAPQVEHPMYHFHQLYHGDLTSNAHRVHPTVVSSIKSQSQLYLSSAKL